MAGLLDFLMGQQGGAGLLGPGSMNFGAGDPSQYMAQAQGAPQYQPVQQMPQQQPPQQQMVQPSAPQPQGQGQAQPGAAYPDALGSMSMRMLMYGRPDLANAVIQNNVMQQVFKSLPADMPFAKKYAIANDPKVREFMYGAPVHVGDVTTPNKTTLPVIAHGGAPSAYIPDDPVIRSSMGAPIEVGKQKVGDLESSNLFVPGAQGGQLMNPLFGNATNSPAALQNSIKLNNQMQQGQPQQGGMQGLPNASPGLRNAIDLSLGMDAQKKVQDSNILNGQKQYEGINAQARQWNGDLKPYNDLARTILNDPRMYSGIGANAVLDWNKVKTAFGGRPDTAALMEGLQKVTASNVLGQVNNQRAQLQEAGQQSSRIFSQQVDLVTKAAQSVENTGAGNRLLTEVQARMGDLSDQIAQQARDYRKAHGYLDAGFDQHLADYMKAHPVFTDAERSNPMLLAAPTVPPNVNNNEALAAWAKGMGVESGGHVRYKGKVVQLP